MRILSSREARLVDGHTMISLGITGESLMGRAGFAVGEKAKEMLVMHGGKRVVIVCGKGNNGGDGYAAAAGLQQFDTEISLLSTAARKEIAGDARIFHDRCVELGISIEYDVKAEEADLAYYDLIIDGLLGTGTKGSVRPAAAAWIDKINMAKGPVLAVDIPSGVCSDSGQVLGKAVRADATVTMGFLKQGLVMNPGADLAGEITLADIGYPAEAFGVLDYEKKQIPESLAQEYLSRPPSDTYKHRQGKVLVLAGSRGFTGAGCLASEAALRGGAGLVIAGVPESLNAIFETKLTEVITAVVPDNGTGRFNPDSIKYLESYFEWCHAIAIGPGVGTEPDVQQFMKTVFKEISRPFVIDADALRVFQGSLNLFKEIKEEFIVTPHYGEAASLFGVEKQTILDDPFEFAHQAARKTSGVVVLKGAPTLVADSKTVTANSTGHQGLATGGSGDVLTGLIAGFLAQGMSASVAAQLGVFVHGKAADFLLESHGFRGMIAGDLLKTLPRVISSYELG